MTKRIYAALVAAVAALSFTAAADAAVHCDGRQQCQHKHKAAPASRRRARASRERPRALRRNRRRAVAYVCPMHPDIREQSQGTCPKCLMDLVAEPRGAKPGAASGAAAGVSAPGGM